MKRSATLLAAGLLSMALSAGCGNKDSGQEVSGPAATQTAAPAPGSRGAVVQQQQQQQASRMAEYMKRQNQKGGGTR